MAEGARRSTRLWRARMAMAAAALTLLATGCRVDDPGPGDTYVAPADPLSGLVQVADAVHYGPSSSQVLDVYVPTVPAAAPRPVLVWVHGGAWVGSNRLALAGAAGYIPELARRLGAGVVSIDFRQAPDPPFAGPSGTSGTPSGTGTAQVVAERTGAHATSAVPLTTMVGDVTAALAFVRQQAGTWGLDPTRLVLMGDSSGAHLAALSAYAGRSFSEAGPQPGWSGAGAGSVRALVSLVGPTDLQLLAGSGVDVLGVPLARYVTAALGCEPAACPSNRWRAADPTSWIGPASPPTWIVVGDGDTLVPTVHGERWYQSLVSMRGTDETDAIDVVDTGDGSWRTHNGVELGLNLTFLELWLRERVR